MRPPLNGVARLARLAPAARAPRSRVQAGYSPSSPSPSTRPWPLFGLNHPVENDCRLSGQRKGSSTLGAEGMDFEAASESVDGDIHVVSVTGEADLATRDPS